MSLFQNTKSPKRFRQCGKKNKKQNDLPPIVLKLYRFHLLIVLPSSAWVVGDLEVLSSSMHYVQKCLQKWWPLCSFMHVLSCLLKSGLCFFNQKNNSIPASLPPFHQLCSTYWCNCFQLCPLTITFISEGMSVIIKMTKCFCLAHQFTFTSFTYFTLVSIPVK